MAIIQYAPINTSNADLTQVQTSIKQSFDTLTNKRILDGVLRTSITIGTSATPISHGLGRKPVGYIIVSSSVAATFIDNINTTATTSTFSVTASAQTVANIWVF